MTWGRIYKTELIDICKRIIGEWANSRLGESVSELYRAKIRLGESVSELYRAKIRLGESVSELYRAKIRLGESVSELYRAKIRLGEFKAVYSTSSWEQTVIVTTGSQLTWQWSYLWKSSWILTEKFFCKYPPLGTTLNVVISLGWEFLCNTVPNSDENVSPQLHASAPTTAVAYQEEE